MNPEDVVAVVEGIGELASPMAQEAWRLAVRQTYVTGATCLLGVIVGIACLVGATSLIMRGIRESAQGDFGDDGFGWIIGGAACAVTGMVLAIPCGHMAIQALFNPEWYAITILLGR